MVPELARELSISVTQLRNWLYAAKPWRFSDEEADNPVAVGRSDALIATRAAVRSVFRQLCRSFRLGQWHRFGAAIKKVFAPMRKTATWPSFQ